MCAYVLTQWHFFCCGSFILTGRETQSHKNIVLSQPGESFSDLKLNAAVGSPGGVPKLVFQPGRNEMIGGREHSQMGRMQQLEGTWVSEYSLDGYKCTMFCLISCFILQPNVFCFCINLDITSDVTEVCVFKHHWEKIQDHSWRKCLYQTSRMLRGILQFTSDCCLYPQDVSLF